MKHKNSNSKPATTPNSFLTLQLFRYDDLKSRKGQNSFPFARENRRKTI